MIQGITGDLTKCFGGKKSFSRKNKFSQFFFQLPKKLIYSLRPNHTGNKIVEHSSLKNT